MKYNASKAIMEYEVYGEGIPVLLLHGFSLDKRIMSSSYEPIFNELNGYKRYYLDLPAMGGSEPLDIVSTEDIYECVKEFISNVICEEFLLFGFSYGGFLSIKLAVDMPEMIKGLSLLCPMVNTDFTTRILPELKCLELDKEYFDGLIDKEDDKEDFFEMAVIANEYTFNRYVNDMLPGMDIARYDVLEDLQKNHYGFEIEPLVELQNFDNPTLILVGKQDSAVGYQEVFNNEHKFTKSSIHIIDRAGHGLIYEQKDKFEFLTLDWLKMMKEL